jgi:hypothetical protein
MGSFTARYKADTSPCQLFLINYFIKILVTDVAYFMLCLPGHFLESGLHARDHYCGGVHWKLLAARLGK